MTKLRAITPRKTHKLSQKQKNLACLLYYYNIPVNEIAKHLEVVPSTIFRIIHAYEVDRITIEDVIKIMESHSRKEMTEW